MSKIYYLLIEALINSNLLVRIIVNLDTLFMHQVFIVVNGLILHYD